MQMVSFTTCTEQIMLTSPLFDLQTKNEYAHVQKLSFKGFWLGGFFEMAQIAIVIFMLQHLMKRFATAC